MVDELIYSELAKSFASGGHFLLREHASAGYGLVYPVLIAPGWAIFKSVPDAYAMAKAINSVVMSLAAVPAYLLARRVVSQAPRVGRRCAGDLGAVDGLHRDADDRERVLPDLPATSSRWSSGSSARPRS